MGQKDIVAALKKIDDVINEHINAQAENAQAEMAFDTHTYLSELLADTSYKAYSEWKSIKAANRADLFGAIEKTFDRLWTVGGSPAIISGYGRMLGEKIYYQVYNLKDPAAARNTFQCLQDFHDRWKERAAEKEEKKIVRELSRQIGKLKMWKELA